MSVRRAERAGADLYWLLSVSLASSILPEVATHAGNEGRAKAVVPSHTIMTRDDHEAPRALPSRRSESVE